MTTTIAVDPGLNGCGIAVGDARGLLDACYIAEYDLSLPFSVTLWLESLRTTVKTPTTDTVIDSRDAVDVIVEKPQIYRAQLQKGDPNDLIDLAWMAGRVEMKLVDWALSSIRGTVKGQCVRPSVWKGQLKKEVCEERAKQRLRADEAPRVRLPKQKGLQHNVWDAVGIYLWATGRFRESR